MSKNYYVDRGIFAFEENSNIPGFVVDNLTPSNSELYVSDYALQTAAEVQEAIEKSGIALTILRTVDSFTLTVLAAEGYMWAEKLIPLSFGLFGMGFILFNVVSSFFAKKIIKAALPKLEKGSTLYVVDSSNVVRAVSYVKSEFLNLSDKPSLTFTVIMDGITLLVDNSKVFFTFGAAQDYADYQKECMYNAIYAAMCNSDANKVLSDPELCDIFLAYTNSVPGNPDLLSPRWEISATTHAIRYIDNPSRYVRKTYEEFDTTKSSSNIICPIFRRGLSLWESPSCEWWNEERERDVKDFLLYYKDFKATESTILNGSGEMVCL